jgi:alkylation response protein AidB-like acyl-CoA dehydrogenase
MDVRLNEEQELLRDSAREFLARECPLAQVRAWCEAGEPLPGEVWTRMAELGWPGLVIPEAYGGAGLGALELAVVLEEMGAALLPGPFFASAVLGAGAIVLGGNEEQRREWLPGLADGSRLATLALYEGGGRWGAEGVSLRAEPDGDGWRLTGSKQFVPEADAADVIAVAARTGSGDDVSLFLVKPQTEGLELRRVAWHDLTRRVHALQFDAVRSDALLGDAGAAGPVLERVLSRGRAALAAEMSGGAARVLETGVAFAKQREQFGRPIGSFQAIQHRCADMLLYAEGARSAAWYAAWALDADEPDADVAACMAKAYASEAFSRVAGDGIQIHGGLGFTWEQDSHLYYKRAKAGEMLLGDATWNRERIAKAILHP